MQWFRFYHNTHDDTKLRRIARKTQQPLAQILGIWTILLSLASKSPVRGELWLAEGIPVTEEDIEDLAGCNVSETLRNMIETHMVTLQNVSDVSLYVLPNWGKRQYASDNSTERVRRYRERLRKAQKGSGEATSNGNETLHTRSKNVSETPPDSDSDSESQIQNLAAKPPSPDGDMPVPVNLDGWLSEIKASKNRQAVLRRMIEMLYPDLVDIPDYGYIGRVAKKLGAGRLATLLWQCAAQNITGDVLAYVQKVAKNGNRNSQSNDGIPPLEPGRVDYSELMKHIPRLDEMIDDEDTDQ